LTIADFGMRSGGLKRTANVCPTNPQSEIRIPKSGNVRPARANGGGSDGEKGAKSWENAPARGSLRVCGKGSAAERLSAKDKG
jgi:hypothetical protein